MTMGWSSPRHRLLDHLRQVVAQFEALEATVATFEPIKTQLAFDTALKMYGSDGNSAQLEL